MGASGELRRHSFRLMRDCGGLDFRWLLRGEHLRLPLLHLKDVEVSNGFSLALVCDEALAALSPVVAPSDLATCLLAAYLLIARAC